MSIDLTKDGAMTDADISGVLAGFPDDTPPLNFGYLNHRGVYAVRSAYPMSVGFGATEWHPEPQWLMHAFDTEKRALRSFAMRDMTALMQSLMPGARGAKPMGREEGLSANEIELRQWLHRIDEATNPAVASGELAKVVNRAALDALAGKAAHRTFGLGLGSVAPAVRPMGRAEMKECFGCLDEIERFLDQVPHGLAKMMITSLEAVRSHIGDTLPGGFLDFCEGCGRPLGFDEPGIVPDFESGIHLCAECGPSPEEIEAQRREIAAEVDFDAQVAAEGIRPGDEPEHGLASLSITTDQPGAFEPEPHTEGDMSSPHHAEFPLPVFKPVPGDELEVTGFKPIDKLLHSADAEGWIEWNGGECPVVPIGTLVEVKVRGGSILPPTPAWARWWGRSAASPVDHETVAYRITLASDRLLRGKP